MSNVTVSYNTLVKKIIGNGTQVTAVQVEESQKNYELKTSSIIIAIGNEPNVGFLKESVGLDKDGYIIVNGITQEASLPGVFAAGDVTEGRVHLAVVAAGDGTQAGFGAVKFLVDNLDNKKSKESDYIVCFCKGISYSKIIKAIKKGNLTLNSLQKKLGVCTGCRACKKRIESILKAELDKKKT